MTTTQRQNDRLAAYQGSNDSWGDFRIREYSSALCDMVEAGEITDVEANQRLSDFQDRMARDGAWG